MKAAGGWERIRRRAGQLAGGCAASCGEISHLTTRACPSARRISSTCSQGQLGRALGIIAHQVFRQHRGGPRVAVMFSITACHGLITVGAPSQYEQGGGGGGPVRMARDIPGATRGA